MISLTFDVEKVGCVRQGLPRVLALLHEHQISATFFVTVEAATYDPSLLRGISSAGHEVASHGLEHEPLRSLDPTRLRAVVRDSKRVLEDLLGQAISGFRAPAFTANTYTYQVLSEERYAYCSVWSPRGVAPARLWMPSGEIVLVPCQAETFGPPRTMQGRTITEWLKALPDSISLLTVCLHPFRDGSRANLPLLEQLLTTYPREAYQLQDKAWPAHDQVASPSTWDLAEQKMSLLWGKEPFPLFKGNRHQAVVTLTQEWTLGSATTYAVECVAHSMQKLLRKATC